jgi:purine-nucleoside phosphorylase
VAHDDAGATTLRPGGYRRGVTLLPPLDPYRLADAAAQRLREITGIASHDVALVMGSGWVPAADVLSGDQQPSHDLASTDLPGFAPPAVEGHAGRIRSIRIGDHRALVFLGRTHLYEGQGVAGVVHSVRTAVAAGAQVVVLTNGCGGLRPTFKPGQAVLISDHINLTATSPIVGARFIDLTDLYSTRLRALCRQVDPTLEEGVYVQFPGPHYETPAEIAMVRAIGGDLVGMSTTLEAIAAREAGADVLGISLVTNLAAGITGNALDHEEVLAAGRAAATGLGELLAQVLSKL